MLRQSTAKQVTLCYFSVAKKDAEWNRSGNWSKLDFEPIWANIEHLSLEMFCICGWIVSVAAQTSVFVFAAVAFKNAKQLEEAKEAYLQEAEAHTNNRAYPYSYTHLCSAVQL